MGVWFRAVRSPPRFIVVGCDLTEELRGLDGVRYGVVGPMRLFVKVARGEPGRRQGSRVCTRAGDTRVPFYRRCGRIWKENTLIASLICQDFGNMLVLGASITGALVGLLPAFFSLAIGW